MASPIITLTTDFGTRDSYVAQMKGAILSVNPDAKIIDVTHDIPAQDVMAGAYELAQMWQVFPVGTIHVAVVDPGVGTDRRIIAARCNGHYFVLPDNGLLTRVLEMSQPGEVVAVQDRRFMRSNVSHTFHGRDVMAPVAAHISLGTKLPDLGPTVDELVRLELTSAKCEPNKITGEIIHIDRFGNLVSNIRTEDFIHVARDQVTINCLGHRIKQICDTYGDQAVSSLIALIGSQGQLELAIVNGDASRQLEAVRGDLITLSW